ncbi:hypothetical protein G5B00_17455 [Parapedobacter sp. SGR-10]|uniref:hypothetical protein n=1 Tax=Parapedobacter sp. SGR-10 TaxID=2710879 RepID=UPI0013D1B54C|nr:hypothetical protein [Parapedobacter sp. SGR-10]NGF58293.1 hypothetical protein [Parapedobacter sp. SGR-10]
MRYYEELLKHLQAENREKAAILEEEVNIMTHKLKYLPAESFPSVVILSQKDDFIPLSSESLHEKVTLAGGKLTADVNEGPHIVIVLQQDESLYSQLFELLQQPWLLASSAYQNNAIFVIEKTYFDGDLYDYLVETEILAEILQPKYFYFGHEGSGWIKFDIAG